MRLDHFFILTEKHAPEAELLIEAGFTEGTSNDHPGQGTANRRFFFFNTALELLYVREANEAEEGPGHGLRLSERVSNPVASPFGLIVRRNGDSQSPAFPGWFYQPMYFDAGVRFLVGENSERLEEPLCICMPESPPPGSSQSQSAAPFVEVTGLRLHVPVDEPSSVLQAIASIDGICIQTGSAHLLEVAFGHEGEGKQRDFRPRLPLIVRW